MCKYCAISYKGLEGPQIWCLQVLEPINMDSKGQL